MSTWSSLSFPRQLKKNPSACLHQTWCVLKHSSWCCFHHQSSYTCSKLTGAVLLPRICSASLGNLICFPQLLGNYSDKLPFVASAVKVNAAWPGRPGLCFVRASCLECPKRGLSLCGYPEHRSVVPIRVRFFICLLQTAKGRKKRTQSQITWQSLSQSFQWRLA